MIYRHIYRHSNTPAVRLPPTGTTRGYRVSGTQMCIIHRMGARQISTGGAGRRRPRRRHPEGSRGARDARLAKRFPGAHWVKGNVMTRRHIVRTQSYDDGRKHPRVRVKHAVAHPTHVRFVRLRGRNRNETRRDDATRTRHSSRRGRTQWRTCTRFCTFWKKGGCRNIKNHPFIRSMR